MIRWNIVGISAGAAFGLSFILGILAGNPFFLLLFNAFIFGAVFGGLATGIMFILDKFVPEVFQSEAVPRSKKKEGGVDIVLSDDVPVFGEMVEEIGRADDDSQSGEYSSEDTKPLAEYSRERKPEPEMESDEGGESFFSDEPAREEKKNNYPSDDAGTDFRDPGKNESEYSPEPDPSRPEGNRPENDQADGDVDILPDMSAFESSFSVPDTGDNESGYTFDQFSPGKLGDSGIDKDPDTLAKAVRTIIKRDEKGS